MGLFRSTHAASPRNPGTGRGLVVVTWRATLCQERAQVRVSDPRGRGGRGEGNGGGTKVKTGEDVPVSSTPFRRQVPETSTRCLTPDS